MQELSKALLIILLNMSVYHGQLDGLVDHCNQVLKGILTKRAVQLQTTETSQHSPLKSREHHWVSFLSSGCMASSQPCSILGLGEGKLQPSAPQIVVW